MARSRMAVTALGTTLYELAYFGVPAMILANYDSDVEALAWYADNGPHLPLGVADALSAEGLRASLRTGMATLRQRRADADSELARGAERLARELLGLAA